MTLCIFVRSVSTCVDRDSPLPGCDASKPDVRLKVRYGQLGNGGFGVSNGDERALVRKMIAAGNGASEEDGFVRFHQMRQVCDGQSPGGYIDPACGPKPSAVRSAAWIAKMFTPISAMLYP